VLEQLRLTFVLFFGLIGSFSCAPNTVDVQYFHERAFVPVRNGRLSNQIKRLRSTQCAKDCERGKINACIYLAIQNVHRPNTPASRKDALAQINTYCAAGWWRACAAMGSWWEQSRD